MNYSKPYTVFQNSQYTVSCGILTDAAAEVLTFRNGLQYRNSDFKRLNRMNFSTLCTILVTFGPETPEFTLLAIKPFAAIRQKSAYHVKYLRISWT